MSTKYNYFNKHLKIIDILFLGTMHFKEFKSDISEDCIKVMYFNKHSKAGLNIKVIDNVAENIKLITIIIDHLRHNSLKWISLYNSRNYIIPTNSVTYVENNFICILIEDFETFYLKNLTHMVKLNMVRTDHSKSKQIKGWTQIIDKKKQRKDKFNRIKKDIEALAYDWNEL